MLGKVSIGSFLEDEELDFLSGSSICAVSISSFFDDEEEDELDFLSSSTITAVSIATFSEEELDFFST